MQLNKDLREFIELLNSAKVNFVLVGGHAVAFHGYPRYTGDMDFFVECSTENAARLEQVIQGFGFGSLGLTSKDFLEAGTIIQLGRPPHRIDLMTAIEGVTFAEAWATKIPTMMDGLPVPVISKELLIQNKQTARREKDLADLSYLRNEKQPPGTNQALD